MSYSNMRPEDLILRDLLARDRTVLANERTLLSYIRTAFGFLAGGVTLIKLFPEDQVLLWLGVALLIAAGVFTVIGVFRFWTTIVRMNAILREPRESTSAEKTVDTPG